MAALPSPNLLSDSTSTLTQPQPYLHSQPHQPQPLAHRRSSSILLLPATRHTSPPPFDDLPTSATTRNKGSGVFFSRNLNQEKQLEKIQRLQQTSSHLSGDRPSYTMQQGQRGHGSPLHNGPEHRRPQYRGSGEFRNGSIGSNDTGNGHGYSHGNGNGHGPLSVPAPSVGLDGRLSNGRSRAGGAYNSGTAGLDGPRSPPGNKNTSHVPCKFYKQGACQAGKACPFLHADGPVTETAPCKYFTKGNCKFGAKCALAHILPDGRRVNRPNLALASSNFPRVSPQDGIDSPTHNSLLSMQAHMDQQQISYTMSPQEDVHHQQQILIHKPSFDGIPTISSTFVPHPASNFGSPPYESRFPTSPLQRGLSVLDAPLPASFDSQGISHMARYGPVAASLPSKFGLDSPPSSLPMANAHGSSALRNLQDSAYGDENVGKLNGLGSSPPVVPEDFLARRFLRTERLSKSRIMSASVGASEPVGSDDWDGNFAFEEDLVPKSLDELLTPEEKLRRLAHGAITNNHDDSALRQSRSSLHTPVDSSSKVGSPSTSSPSRFVGALFPRASGKSDGADPSSLGASPFGHVGSPLRNSMLNSESISANQNALKISDGSSGLASPPRHGSTGMSMISQQLRGMRIGSGLGSRSDALDSHPHSPVQHPGISRIASGSSVGSSSLNRAVPHSSSNGTRDRGAEDEQGLFSMEEEDDQQHQSQPQQYKDAREKENADERERKREQPANGKRLSAGWMFGLGTNSGRGSPSPASRPLVGTDPRSSSAVGKAALGWS